MKNEKNLLFLLIVLFLVSCSKDDEAIKLQESSNENQQSYFEILMSDQDKIVNLASNLSKSSKLYVKDGVNTRTGQDDLNKEDALVLLEATINLDFEAVLNDNILGFGKVEKSIQIERNSDGLAVGDDIVAKYNLLQTEVTQDLGTTKQLYFGDIELESITPEHLTYKVVIKTLNENGDILEWFGGCTIDETDYWTPWDGTQWHEGGKCGPYSGVESEFRGGPSKARDIINNPCALAICQSGNLLMNWLSVQGFPFGPNESSLGELSWCNDFCLDPEQMSNAVVLLSDIKSNLMPSNDNLPPNYNTFWSFSGMSLYDQNYFCDGDLEAHYWHGNMRYGIAWCGSMPN